MDELTSLNARWQLWQQMVLGSVPLATLELGRKTLAVVSFLLHGETVRVSKDEAVSTKRSTRDVALHHFRQMVCTESGADWALSPSQSTVLFQEIQSHSLTSSGCVQKRWSPPGSRCQRRMVRHARTNDRTIERTASAPSTSSPTGWVLGCCGTGTRREELPNVPGKWDMHYMRRSRDCYMIECIPSPVTVSTIVDTLTAMSWADNEGLSAHDRLPAICQLALSGEVDPHCR